MATEKKQEEAKVKVEEGNASYPFYTIEDCLPRMKPIAGRYGVGGSPAPRKDVCILLKKAEPTLIYFFGSTFQYKLLENVPGKGVVVGDIFQKIDAPVHGEQGRKTAMIQAMYYPPLYKKLIDEYNGKILPNEEGLANLFITKEYGVNKNSAGKAAKIFFENAKSLDIVDSNNRLSYLTPTKIKGGGAGDGGDGGEDDKSKLNGNGGSGAEHKSDPKMFELPIDLGGEGVAYLKYPKNISSDEISILKIMLDATLTALEKRQKKTENVE